MTDPHVELNVERDPVEYPANADIDEQRRAFLVECYANAEIDIAIQLPALKLLEAFVKTGDVPEPPKRQKLNTVPGGKP